MRKKISQYFLILMAAVTLNSSVDISDYQLYANPDAVQNTSVNEMESVAEIVAECIMDMPNQFPEQKNDDTNPNNIEKKIPQIKFKENFEAIAFNGFETVEKIIPIPEKIYNFNFIREITPPPPKA